MSTRELRQRIRELKWKLARITEIHGCQLAAITTATLQNTETSKKDRIDIINPYWSPAYEDVCQAVDREIRQRARADAAETRVKELEELYAGACRAEDALIKLNKVAEARVKELETALHTFTLCFPAAINALPEAQKQNL